MIKEIQKEILAIDQILSKNILISDKCKQIYPLFETIQVMCACAELSDNVQNKLRLINYLNKNLELDNKMYDLNILSVNNKTVNWSHLKNDDFIIVFGLMVNLFLEIKNI